MRAPVPQEEEQAGPAALLAALRRGRHHPQRHGHPYRGGLRGQPRVRLRQLRGRDAQYVPGVPGKPAMRRGLLLARVDLRAGPGALRLAIGERAGCGGRSPTAPGSRPRPGETEAFRTHEPGRGGRARAGRGGREPGRPRAGAGSGRRAPARVSAPHLPSPCNCPGCTGSSCRRSRRRSPRRSCNSPRPRRGRS